jgi:hypothetical protein
LPGERLKESGACRFPPVAQQFRQAVASNVKEIVEHVAQLIG